MSISVGSNCDLDLISELLSLHNVRLKQASDPVGLVGVASLGPRYRIAAMYVLVVCSSSWVKTLYTGVDPGT